MNTHMMIDFETLGHIPPTPVVLSLGAVLFNREEIIKTGYWIFNVSPQIAEGRTITASTLAWWLKQKPEAREVLEPALNDKGLAAPVILQEFIDMSVNGVKGLKVWSCGAGFDIPIAEDLLRSHGLPIPWMFYSHRCYRTVKELHHIEATVQRTEPKHHALEDARYQARCVQTWLKLNPKADT